MEANIIKYLLTFVGAGWESPNMKSFFWDGVGGE